MLAEQANPANFYEPLIYAFAYLAGQTRRIRPGAPPRSSPRSAQPVLLAGQEATLDRVSGRFVLSLGIGANHEEFEIAGNPRPPGEPGADDG